MTLRTPTVPSPETGVTSRQGQRASATTHVWDIVTAAGRRLTAGASAFLPKAVGRLASSVRHMSAFPETPQTCSAKFPTSGCRHRLKTGHLAPVEI